eukprot:Rmarinus@m.9744
MRQFQLDESLNCTVVTFLEHFIKDKTFKQRYHESRGDTEVSISDWVPGEENTFAQTTEYLTPVNAPDMVKKLIGNYSNTKETASYAVEDEDLIFNATVEPEMPGNMSMKIQYTLRVSNDTNSRVTAHVSGICDSAGLMWAVQGAIENMAHQQTVAGHLQWFAQMKDHLREQFPESEELSVSRSSMVRSSVSRAFSLSQQEPAPSPLSFQERLCDLFRVPHGWRGVVPVYTVLFCHGVLLYSLWQYCQAAATAGLVEVFALLASVTLLSIAYLILQVSSASQVNSLLSSLEVLEKKVNDGAICATELGHLQALAQQLSDIAASISSLDHSTDHDKNADSVLQSALSRVRELREECESCSPAMKSYATLAVDLVNAKQKAFERLKIKDARHSGRLDKKQIVAAAGTGAPGEEKGPVEGECDQLEGAAYRTRGFQELFDLPVSEFVLDYFSCASQGLHGFLYLTQSFVCFDSVLFAGGDNRLRLPLREIKALRKARTVGIFDTAIEITMRTDEVYRFSGFLSRNQAFSIIFKRAVHLKPELRAADAKDDRCVSLPEGERCVSIPADAEDSPTKKTEENAPPNEDAPVQ